MCLAIPGKIVLIEGDKAVVDYEGEKREAILLNKEIKVGDYVVVQNKLILQSVPKKQAIESRKAWEEALKDED